MRDFQPSSYSLRAAFGDLRSSRDTHFSPGDNIDIIQLDVTRTRCRGNVQVRDKCARTGYHGRVGIYELLLTTDQIRAQIHDRASEARIRDTALRDGMRTMHDDGERWVRDGTTTAAELLRVTKE